MRLAAKRCIDVAILVTGDADFVHGDGGHEGSGRSRSLAPRPTLGGRVADLVASLDERVVLDEAILCAASRPANTNGAA